MTDKKRLDAIEARLKRIETLVQKIAVMVQGQSHSSSCGLCGYDYPLHADDCLSPGLRASSMRGVR